jgi:DNA-binding NtrC family response regulator
MSGRTPDTLWTTASDAGRKGWGEVKRILIVDDEARVCFILGRALQAMNEGLAIQTAQTAHQALTKFKEDDFDLLITDVRLQGISGVELTEAVQALNRETAVIWITGFGCHRVHDEGKRLGVHRCLDKPIQIGLFRQVTREVLEEGYG